MRKVFVLSACSSLHGILRPRTILNLRCATSPSVPNALSYFQIKNITSSTHGRLSIRSKGLDINLTEDQKLHTNEQNNGTPTDKDIGDVLFSWIQKRQTKSCMSTAGGNSESSPPVLKSVPVQVAHELLQAGHRYLDVRTPEEFSAGHAVGAINVPLLFRAASGMTKNPNFIEGVSSHFSKEDEIVVGCQAGKRSLIAATDLISAGYTGVTDVAGGYAAWTQNGLPIES